MASAAGRFSRPALGAVRLRYLRTTESRLPDIRGPVLWLRYELLPTGKTDQGLMATGLLEAGWPVPLLWEANARPLPEPLRKTVGAVLSGRLRAAASMPVPGSAVGAAVVPHQAPGPDRVSAGEGLR
ncbi:hypothetical protein [Streptomyces microflavus]|uniref:hypothetical protein n=1 Tax=Streptomyces microflavus TaxID=1919 RepID=UPI00382FDFF1